MIARASDVPRLRRVTTRVQVANARAFLEKKSLIGRYLDAYRETLDWMYASEDARSRYSAFSGLSATAVNRMLADFISRQSLQTQTLHGIIESQEDARTFKFISSQLSESQLKQLVQIPIADD